MPRLATRVQLNDKLIQGLKAAAAGCRDDHWDSLVPGFGVRVTETGSKSYILLCRTPGKKNPERRTLARVGELSLADARAKARDWLLKIDGGVDPVEAARAAERAATTQEEMLVPFVLEKYIATRMTDQKNAKELVALLRREFATRWKDRSVASIKTADVSAVIEGKAQEGSKSQARSMLSAIKQFFRWTTSTGRTEYSPAVIISSTSLLGEQKPRSRTLTDHELRRVWRAALQQPYPLGAVYRALILTGCRVNEICDAKWSEIDYDKDALVIPAERMKAGLAHAIPLTPMLRELLDSLPRGKSGDYIFSASDGVGGFTLGSYYKEMFDGFCGVSNWRNHDIRRTMSTNIEEERLGISVAVQEAMVAHKKQGVRAVYALYQYIDEKRAGFEAWHAKLTAILNGGGDGEGKKQHLRLVA